MGLKTKVGPGSINFSCLVCGSDSEAGGNQQIDHEQARLLKMCAYQCIMTGRYLAKLGPQLGDDTPVDMVRVKDGV